MERVERNRERDNISGENCERKLFPIFSDLNGEGLTKLRQLVRLVKYERGGSIFEQGAPALSFHLVYQGSVKLVMRTLSGKKQILQVINSGGILGEEALFIDRGVHIAYAKTLTPSLIGFIIKEEFHDFLRLYPSVAFKIFNEVSAKLQLFQSKLVERSYASGKARVARLLLQMERVDSNLSLSRAELAEMAGLCVKTTTNALNALEERRLISTDGNNKITLLSKERLAELAEPFLTEIKSGNVII